MIFLRWAILLLVCTMPLAASGAESFYMDLSPQPVSRIMGAFTTAVVSRDADWDRQWLTHTQTKVLAWVDASPNSKTGVTMKEILRKGFSGVVVSNGTAAALKKMRAEAPQAQIWVAGSYTAVVSTAGAYQGWLSMPEEHQVERVAQAVAAGWKVYAIQFAKWNAHADAMEKSRSLAKAGAVPFVTNLELSGAALAPLRWHPRRILVLFGKGDAEPGSAPSFEADTYTATHLQLALEWMGYEVEYFDASRQLPPPHLTGKYAGVIFDSQLMLPFAREKAYVDWTLDQREHGLKILFLGQYPFEQEAELGRLLTSLGMRGTLDPIKAPRGLKVAQLDEKMISGEAAVAPISLDFDDIRAPENARVSIGLEALDATANPVRFDPIFTTSWGGALLDPYLLSQLSSTIVRSYVNPFAFLAEIWPTGNFPAPDVTTRCGNRIFYSHIDGDGFVYETSFDRRKLCGEVIRDEVLKKYPFPVTCSVIEAEITADQAGIKLSEAPRFLRAAQEMFKLPNIQAGTHSYSHPFIWIESDQAYLPMYDQKNLTLRPEVAYPKILARREVEGSINYIEKHLLPPGNKVEIMLWSGNCRPGAEALRVCDELMIENMNGGNTSITKRQKFASNIGPKTMTWQGRRQIHAANQNEYIYTRNWSGPFFNGFRQVIETFDLTEKPHRTKPINLYYHFYSAAHIGSLKSLHDILDWCMRQELHCMTARQYAEMVRDSCDTEILQLSAQHWRIITNGQLQTLRLPASSPPPSMDDCSGVLGWRRLEQGLFIHTDGSRTINLIFAPPSDQKEPKRNVTNRPFVVKSDAPLKLFSLPEGGFRLQLNDFRPISQLQLGGLKPGSLWNLAQGGNSVSLTVDSEGHLSISAPGKGEVLLSPKLSTR